MDNVNIRIDKDNTAVMDKILLENKEIKAHFTIVNENTIRLK